MTLANSIFDLPAIPGFQRRRGRACGGFTLLEIMVASVAAAIIMAAIYGLFFRALKMRDNATDRTRDARLRARAVNVIRNDLRNALVSGGLLATTLAGDVNGTDGPDAAFPGYLKLTTTTGRDRADEMYGDVQQVEYYIARDKNGSPAARGGVLTRLVTRDLLATVPDVTHEEQILSGVESFQVYFYDGTQWQQTWQVSGTDATNGTEAVTTGTATASGTGSIGPVLPAAIRIDIQQAAQELPGRPQQPVAPPPLEVLVPWTTVPFLSGTKYTIGSGTVSPLPAE